MIWFSALVQFLMTLRPSRLLQLVTAGGQQRVETRVRPPMSEAVDRACRPHAPAGWAGGRRTAAPRSRDLFPRGDGDGVGPASVAPGRLGHDKGKAPSPARHPSTELAVENPASRSQRQQPVRRRQQFPDLARGRRPAGRRHLDLPQVRPRPSSNMDSSTRVPQGSAPAGRSRRSLVFRRRRGRL